MLVMQKNANLRTKLCLNQIYKGKVKFRRESLIFTWLCNCFYLGLYEFDSYSEDYLLRTMQNS